MRAQLLHLSGPLRGRTITYEQSVVRVGHAQRCEVPLLHALVADEHAQIEWVQDQCKFHLRRVDGQVFVNGKEVEEIILKDEDLLEFGAGGPMARFRTYVPEGAVCKPVRSMLSDAAEVARYSGTVTATRTLTSDLLTKATLQLKVGFPLLVGGVAVALWLWFGSALRQVEERMTADRVTRSELERMRDAHQAQIDRLQRSNAMVLDVQKRWARGVCLVHGVYRLRMPDGAWFTPTPGATFEREYTGSGFLVSAAGHIVTNRHVALPWTEEPALAPLLDGGAEPVFTTLTVTFPGHAPAPVAQETIVRRPDDLDVAVFQLQPEEVEGIPVLPLQRRGGAVGDGRAIVVGYPTGLAALLARADAETLARLRRSAASMSDAIEQLAGAGAISPVITEGIVSNVEEHVVAYDAATTSGGSGGPVFGGDGRVIAVNYAIQRNFDGNNLGVPIVYAQELLPE